MQGWRHGRQERHNPECVGLLEHPDTVTLVASAGDPAPDPSGRLGGAGQVQMPVPARRGRGCSAAARAPARARATCNGNNVVWGAKDRITVVV